VANVEGKVDPKYSRVRDVFAEILEAPHELGAGLSIVVDGRTVVELSGGFSDRARTKPWTRDTLANVFSTTKGWTSLCAHRLVERGQLDDAHRVASYWPEFAQNGKDRIPVRRPPDRRGGRAAVRKSLEP